MNVEHEVWGNIKNHELNNEIRLYTRLPKSCVVGLGQLYSRLTKIWLGKVPKNAKKKRNVTDEPTGRPTDQHSRSERRD